MSDKAKKILFKSKARQKVFKGIHFITDALKTSLGKNHDNFNYDFVKDLISNYIKDDFEKVGAEIALKTVHEVKKNSSSAITALIMLDAILKKGIELVDNNTCPQDINKSLDLALADLFSKLDKITYFIKDTKDLARIVNYYAHHNKDISYTVIKSFEKIGLAGSFILNQTRDSTNKIEVTDGLELDQGYLSHFFCTDEKNMITELNLCKVLIVDKKISSIQEIFPLLKQLTKPSEELLIIAKDLHKDVVSTLAMNKLQKTVKVAAIKLDQNDSIKNLANLTNAKIVTKNDSLLDLPQTALGQAYKAVIHKDRTIIATQNPLKGCSHLKNKIAIIHMNISDTNQTKMLYNSCIEKTKMAIEQGVIVGGNFGLFFALHSIDKSNIVIGIDLLKAAIYAPLMQMIFNAGHDPKPILKSISNMGYPNGFNLNTHKIDNFLESGILDPVKIVKNSLEYVVSTAKTLMLTDALMIK